MEGNVRVCGKASGNSIIRSLTTRSALTEYSGKIHSVFEHAVNLSFRAEAGSMPLLLTCTVHDEGLPDGAVIPETVFHDLTETGRGGPVMLKGNTLFTGHFCEKLSEMPCLTVKHMETTALSRLLSVTDKMAAEAPGIPERRRRRAEENLLQVVESLARQDPVNAEASAVQLIGLGSGLTPGADDALVGMMASLKAAGFLVPFLSASSLHATTDISAKYLYCAQNGAFSGRVSSLFEACEKAESTICTAAERAAAWGASSGRDMLWGIQVTLHYLLAKN